MTREEIKAIYDLGPEAVIELVECLWRLIEEQQRELPRVKQRVKKLEDRRALSSRNSSQPPSSDRFVKKTVSLRQPSGKRPGAQAGHPGRTLHRVSVKHCQQCQQTTVGAFPDGVLERGELWSWGEKPAALSDLVPIDP